MPIRSTLLDGEAKAFAEEQTARIRERLAGRAAEEFAAIVPRMLERAAWVDLACNPLEGTLVPWTLKTVRDHLYDPTVRDAVGKVRDAYEPGFSAAAPELSAVRDRVRTYAEDILSGGDKPLGPR